MHYFKKSFMENLFVLAFILSMREQSKSKNEMGNKHELGNRYKTNR